MHAQRAADPADLHEHVDEVGLGRQQLAELVADDQQAGQRGQRHPGRAGPLVVPQRGVVAGRAQQLLAADQLAVDRVGHPVDQRQLVGQVGDDRAGVRQPVQPGERRAALEVDSARSSASRSRACTARASTRVRSSSDLPEPVAPTSSPCGPIAVLGGLLEVQLDAVRRRRRRRSGPAAGRGWGGEPSPSETSKRERVGDAEQVGQVGGGGHRLLARCPGGQPERRELAGQGLRRGTGERVGLPELDLAVGGAAARAGRRRSTSRTRVPRSSSRGGAVVRSSTVTPSTPPSLARWSGAGGRPRRPGRRARAGRRRWSPVRWG